MTRGSEGDGGGCRPSSLGRPDEVGTGVRGKHKGRPIRSGLRTKIRRSYRTTCTAMLFAIASLRSTSEYMPDESEFTAMLER